MRTAMIAFVVATLLVPATAAADQLDAPADNAPLAPDAAVPTKLIRKMVDDAFAVLRDPKLQVKERRKERIDKLRVLADRVFDWEQMARSSLGVYWRDLDAAERSEYIVVFKEILAQQYMSDIDRSTGTERVVMTGADKKGPNIVVKTLLITHSRERVPVFYFMHPQAKSWRVHDVSIEGVSLVNHYRKSFHRFLVNDSFASLMQRLKQKLPRDE